MDDDARGEVTLLIEASRGGDTAARDRLFAVVYDELRAVARRTWRVGRYGDTMQPTVLANEAYLFFEKHFPVPPQGERENRETFFRTVALAMRTILRDYWRGKQAAKRGGGERPVPLDDIEVAESNDGDFGGADFLDLDEALHRLEGRNARWFSIVMHRYFGGRTIEETAELLGLALSTVKIEWQLARAWLRQRLGMDSRA